MTIRKTKGNLKCDRKWLSNHSK